MSQGTMRELLERAARQVTALEAIAGALPALWAAAEALPEHPDYFLRTERGDGLRRARIGIIRLVADLAPVLAEEEAAEQAARERSSSFSRAEEPQ